MQKPLLVVLAASLFISCQQEVKKEESFELTGNVKNVPDSTWVMMQADNKLIDSAMVLDETFKFTGVVEEPLQSVIHLKGSSDFAYIFIENSKMQFQSGEGNFENGKTTGSKAQQHSDILDERLEPVNKSRDSLYLLFADKDLTQSSRDSLLVVSQSLREKDAEVTQQFIRDYPNAYISTRVLDIMKFAWGREVTGELYSLMNEERRNSEKGKIMAKFIEVNLNPQVGDKYADFELKNVDGEPVRLSNTLKKYTLLEFWASWCGPCRKTNPELVKNYNRFKEKGFEIYAVSIDDKKEAWIKAIEEDGLQYENVSDLIGKNTEAGLIYGVKGVPDNFLIDQNGTIIARNISGKDLTKKLEELFGEPTLAAAE